MHSRFFISSSTEKLDVARAIESNLAEFGFEPTLWLSDAHRASEYNLESLVREVNVSDFAVFVFSPDDEAKIRGEMFPIVRDNVLFELGLFIGALGRKRCFITRPKQSKIRLPPDLDGLTTLPYESERSDSNVKRALGPVTTAIADTVSRVAVDAKSQFTRNDLDILKACTDTSMPSNQYFRVNNSFPEKWDDKLCMRFLRLQQEGLIRVVGPTEIEATRKGNQLTQGDS